MFKPPNHYFVSSGSGAAGERLVAFDRALRAAGISDFNLVRISSILPARCARETLAPKPCGQPILVAYGSTSSDVAGETIASAVCAAEPVDANSIGVIMECSGVTSAVEVENRVRKMALQAMSDRGIEVKELVSSSTETVVLEGSTSAVISAVTIW